MTDILKGKVCAITGGATGIGRAIAIKFAEQGASVAVNHLDDPRSHEYISTLKDMVCSASRAGENKFFSYAGDISASGVADKFLEATAARFGALDVVVANAGIARFHEFLSAPDSFIEDHLRINVQGCYFTTRAAGRILKAQGRGGSIIGISSISALCGSGELVHYTTTKAAVLNIMQSAAVALGPFKIRCNALLPGTIETQLNTADLSVPERRKAVIDRTCLKRVGHVDDLAGPAVFLASDLSTYCSGAQLLVDGGLLINQGQ